MWKSLLAAILLALTSMHALAAERITPDELHALLQQDKAPLIIDVRSEQEYLEGHVPNAMLIPHEEIGDYTETLAEHRDARIVLYCSTNRRGQIAVDELEQAGFGDLVLLEGAFPAWKEAGHPVE